MVESSGQIYKYRLNAPVRKCPALKRAVSSENTWASTSSVYRNAASPTPSLTHSPAARFRGRGQVPAAEKALPPQKPLTSFAFCFSLNCSGSSCLERDYFSKRERRKISYDLNVHDMATPRLQQEEAHCLNAESQKMKICVACHGE